MQLKIKIPLILFSAYCIVVGLLTTTNLTNSSKLYGKIQEETALSIAKSRADIVKGFMDVRVAELRSVERTITVENGKRSSDEEKILTLNESVKFFMNSSKVVSSVYVFLRKERFKRFIFWK